MIVVSPDAVDRELRLRHVSHLIHKIKDVETRNYLDLRRIEAAFKDYPVLGYRILSCGHFGIFIHFENKTNIFIRYRRPSGNEPFTRPFDIPILWSGVTNDIHWLIQPHVDVGLADAECNRLFEQLVSPGYIMYGPTDLLVGMYEGQPRVLDPLSVEYPPTRWATAVDRDRQLASSPADSPGRRNAYRSGTPQNE